MSTPLATRDGFRRGRCGERPGRDLSSQRGQIIVLVAGAMFVLIAGVALVIEAGNAFAQQRVAQNGADGAANAGAVVLGERLGGATRTNADVYAAMVASASANGLANPAGTYTDIDGNLLAGEVVTDDAGAIPAAAAGIHVTGDRDFATLLARVVNISELRASADATAVAGLLNGVCAADAGCGVIPITFPVLISSCEAPHTNTPVGSGPYTLVSIDQRTSDNMSIVPLCTIGPGSIGYLDLGPGNLASEITNPTNRSFNLPTWLQTQTGAVNAIEPELNSYAGTVILIPMFDGTCKVEPRGTNLADCPAGQEGTGDNTWYHVPKFTGFFLDRAYIQGSDVECKAGPGSPLMGGGGSVACMKGWFVRFITQGPVTAGGADDTSAIGIQLKR